MLLHSITNECPQYIGKEYRPEVTCVDGMCKPQNPNIPEACLYICGKGTCDHISKCYFLYIKILCTNRKKILSFFTLSSI